MVFSRSTATQYEPAVTDRNSPDSRTIWRRGQKEVSVSPARGRDLLRPALENSFCSGRYCGHLGDAELPGNQFRGWRPFGTDWRYLVNFHLRSWRKTGVNS